ADDGQQHCKQYTHIVLPVREFAPLQDRTNGSRNSLRQLRNACFRPVASARFPDSTMRSPSTSVRTGNTCSINLTKAWSLDQRKCPPTRRFAMDGSAIASLRVL